MCKRIIIERNVTLPWDGLLITVILLKQINWNATKKYYDTENFVHPILWGEIERMLISKIALKIMDVAIGSYV